MAAVVIRGTPYPVLLPKLRDPRLHLAATITSLQVIGQIGFHFRLSIAQILVSLGTCAVLEVAIAFRRQRVILWPASALLTGNGVAFVLRVPGTAHGDWWSLRGWWIFAGTAALSLLSKHVITWRGEHVFNPSNIGLVVCFVALGRNRADPLDFWWGPMSPWLVLALAVILAGGFTILGRLRLLRIALGFWLAFAAGIGVLALTGHSMLARWHLGPITGFHFFWVLVTSPEVLVFLFFMITDPKTAPRSPNGRLAYAVSLGLLAALLIAPTTSEFAAKVALLGSLVVVCVAIPLVRHARLPVDRRLVLLVAPAAAAAYAATIVLSGTSAGASGYRALPPGTLPPIEILPSHGVQTQLDRHTAELIAHDLLASTHMSAAETLQLHLAPGRDQDPPFAVALIGGRTFELTQAGNEWRLRSAQMPQELPQKLPAAPVRGGDRLVDVASSLGLDFRQGSFRFGMSNDYRAMMGGGVCFLDYNGDGFVDLFAVNSYASADTAQWEAHGGLPRTALYENVHGRFRDVTGKAHAGLAVQGDGCVAADLNGDGRPDLVVTTTSGVDLLWNDGNGTFTEHALPASGWYAGAAVADVNGDGRPDIFVAGYTDPNEPVPNSLAGFPTNLAGVRDLLYLNEGHGRFREVGVQAGLESAQPRHGLGAVFLDANGDGRPDLYVANDEDPNELYVNVPWPGGAKADPAGLGFRFEERGAAAGVADPYAGMGIAAGTDAAGRLQLFVSNSRQERSAAFRLRPGATVFTNARPAFDDALGTGFAGWGASFVDLWNSGSPDLVLAAGAIPVTSLAADAEPVRVLGTVGAGTVQRYGDARGLLGPQPLRLNGRGLAAADVANDGRMDVAINQVGGRLALLHPQGPAGHWLEVSLSRFEPGAVVTATLPGGRRVAGRVQAGSSYLSSEDPRVHLGLGTARRVARLTVRYPWGGESVLRNVRADRIVQVRAPAPRSVRSPSPAGYRLAACTRASLHGRSIARIWNETTLTVLRDGGFDAPVQARDLFHLAAATWNAWAAYDPAARGWFVTQKASTGDVAAARDAAISYAAYRLLLWRASFGSNLDRTFALLEHRLRSLCYSPDFTRTAGGSPAAVGNRIAAAAIRAGRRDGSLESLHYVDPAYTPQNGPLVVAQPGSTVHDPTFWQPLALGEKAAHGLSGVPADVQTFADAQWGRVRGFGSLAGLRPAAPALGLPEDASYKNAAVAVIRATAAPGAGVSVDGSPLAWNAVADALPRASLEHDAELSLALNGALFDASIVAWGAKRAFSTPRPISMIRYLAFQGQSSDPKAASYNREGLPLVPGLIELGTNGQVTVREGGRFVLGTRWTPPGTTPASPGFVSGTSAFAAAASEVLHAFTGRSFAARAARASASGLTAGIHVPADLTAGWAVGTAAGRRALALATRVTSAP